MTEEPVRRTQDKTQAAPVAKLVNVGLSYGKTRALDNVSLDVPSGIMVGLIGPESGAVWDPG